LRQQYLSDPDWLDFLKPGPAGTLNQMVQVY
jgi:hypothetical protein